MSEKENREEEQAAPEQADEEPVCGQEMPAGANTPDNREAELDKARAEAAEYKDKWIRTAAEFENFRKRNAETRRTSYQEGMTCDEQTKKGIEMVLRSFKALLEGEGVEEICPVGEEFDPKECEAIMSEPASDGVEPGYVKEVFLKGYKKGDKILRFAQVKVTM